MSRVGYLPVPVPSGVTVEVSDGSVLVRGPKAEKTVELQPGVSLEQADGELRITRESDDRDIRSRHGLFRTLLANAVIGASEGFQKVLQVEGVGYKVQVSGNQVILNLGYSHPLQVTLPQGVEANVEGNTLTISGTDKQLVGQIAADIRELRPPEPYKGKGVKYKDERIIRKAGKAAGAGK